jgi:hypothetical protein
VGDVVLQEGGKVPLVNFYSNLRSENYFQVTQTISPRTVINEQFYIEIMTENYSSGNNKIRERSSIHMRHKKLCVNWQIQNFWRA